MLFEVHGIDGEANFKALGRKVRLIRKHIPAPDGLNIHPVYAQGKIKQPSSMAGNSL